MAISGINLGSFFGSGSSNGTTTGISSGLNTQELIKSLTALQTSQVTSLEDQVTVNNTQGSAMGTLTQILTTLQSAIKPISNPNSLDVTTNLFAVRTSNITSNTTQAAANYVTATVASGTATGSYTISAITQLASYANQETNEFTLASVDDSVVRTPATNGYFVAGTFVVKGQNITISADDSLTEIAQSFNNVSSSTGISASVLQTSAGKYKLVFQSTATGAANDFDLSEIATVSSDPSGVLSRIVFNKNADAENAKFKLNNVDIERSTNAISDLVTGVTINLQQDTTNSPNASFTLQIQPDTSSIALGISNFATAYNNFLYFYSRQTQLDSNTGTPAKSAVLYSDTTLRNIYNSVTSIAESLVTGLADGQPQTLSDIGISFTNSAGDSTTPATSNILSVDSSVLQSKLSTNFNGVANVLGDSFTSTSSKLSIYKVPTDLTVNSLTLNILNTANPRTYIGTYTDANNTTQQVSFTANEVLGGGYSLEAPSDSVFAGMTLLYAGTGDESGIEVTLSRGLLSSLNLQLTSALRTSTGLIATGQKAIAEKNSSLQDQITVINDRISATRSTLTQRFAALEAAITKANSILNLLNAQQLASQT